MAARFKVTAVAIVAVAVIAVAGVVIVVTASGSDDPQQKPERSAGSSPAAGRAAGTSASAGPSVGALTPAAASCTGPGSGMGLPAIAEVSQPARWAFAPDVVVDPHTGHATVAFAAAPAGALTPTSLWSVNLPGAHADQQLVRSGDDGEFPVPYDGGRPIPAERAHTLGVDAAGDQTLVWREEDRPRKQHGLDRMVIRGRVKAASRPTGGSWSRPTVLDPHLALTTETRVAVNDRGAAVAVWVHQTLPDVGAPVISLYASYRPAAKSQWSSPALVAQDELSPSESDFAYNYTPEIGIDRAGNAVVMYERHRGRGAWVRRREAATGAWTPATRLSLASPAGVGDSLVVSANGTAAASLLLYVPSKDLLVWQTARMDPDGTWTRPTRAPVNPETSTPEGLAIDGHGRPLAVWRNKNDDLMVMRSGRDGSWRRSTVLARDQSEAEPLMGVMVAMNARGDAFAAWETEKGKSARLNGSYQRAGRAWTPPRRLTQEHVQPGDYAAAINRRGQAALTWSQASHSPGVEPEPRPGRTVWARQITTCP